MFLKRICLSAICIFAAASAVRGQEIRARDVKGNFIGQTDRPLRYTPDHGDFVIESAAGRGESFNRPLYGSNTAFRVDAGDLPEFMLYLPGRGGNLRLGLRAGGHAKWLHEADKVIARYHDGMMQYELHDALLDDAVLQIEAVPLHDSEGLILQVAAQGRLPGDAELLWAFGGSDGLAGSRRGDIGTERLPVGQFFELHPENCRNNQVTADGSGFTVAAGTRSVTGIVSGEGVHNASADAAQWNSADRLMASAGNSTQMPLAFGRAPLVAAPRYIALRHSAGNRPLLSAAALPQVFAAAKKSREKIASALQVDTPDPFINAAAPALCIAADACWDESQGVMMHGAVAWRNRLLGWRGPYALDDAGWHDRMLRHLTYWAGQQVTDENIPAAAHADPKKNLATDDWVMLHSNGAMSKSHYDMNLAYIDAYLRHALWTGDVEFLRKTWPMLQRHLAWEERCFRRVFKDPQTGEDLPLYEGYAVIWASDNLQYNGGGTAHASALNCYHHLMAARIAKLIGQDPAPYQKEADLILRAMNRLLWVQDKGLFAEFKDLLGPQGLQDNPALWTFYHAIDSDVADPFQAWQMSRYVDTQIAHIPIHGPGVPADAGLCVLPCSNWMPYMWSVNNVVLAENAHTALADWQAQRPAEAFGIFKGNVLDSMFMGLCPGNCHMSSQFDAYRGESQRDFADPTAMMLRALVEGLFGVRPDVLEGAVTVQPGFPEQWDHASIRHSDFQFSFSRAGQTDSYTFEPHFSRPVALHLVLRARSDAISSLIVNDQAAKWKPVDSAIGLPEIQIDAPAADRWLISVTWAGDPLPSPSTASVLSAGDPIPFHPGKGKLLELSDPQQGLSRVNAPDNNGLSVRAGAAPGWHTAFAHLRQGDFIWWMPIDFQIKPPAAMAAIDWNVPVAAGTALDPVDLTTRFNASVADIFKTDYLSPRSPYVSLAIPKQGFGGWADYNKIPPIDDAGLRAAARENGRILFHGIPFRTPVTGKNIAFVSYWDNHPKEITIPLAGSARHLFLLMTGTTNPLRSHIQNGQVIVTYADNSAATLPLVNPGTWWPIDQDYLIDDYAFVNPAPLPPRLDLKTGQFRLIDRAAFAGHGGPINGGAAFVLDLPVDPARPLHSLTLRASTYEVIIGLMSATLER